MLISQTVSCHSTLCSWWGNTFKKAVSSIDPFSVFCFTAFANLFRVYDGKVAISLKNCTKGRKEISEVRNFLLNSLSFISEVVAFLHKHLDIECWMVKPKTLNAAWVLLVEWPWDSPTAGQTWQDKYKHLLKQLHHLFWPYSASIRK